MLATKKYLAYFDILGYQARIKNKNIERELEIQNRFIKDAKCCCEKINAETIEEKISHIHFSDTHIYFTKDDSEIAFVSLVGTVLLFMNLASVRKTPYLPVRGAICFGDFYAKDNTYIGSALREAYNFAENQDWLGCAIAKGCFGKIKDFPRFKKLKQKGILVKYKVPMKFEKNIKLTLLILNPIQEYGVIDVKKYPLQKDDFGKMYLKIKD